HLRRRAQSDRLPDRRAGSRSHQSRPQGVLRCRASGEHADRREGAGRARNEGRDRGSRRFAGRRRMNLKGAVCIVTGAATGSGAACAVQLARKGVRVVVNYSRSEAEAKATVKACEAAGGEAVLGQADVASDADCRALAQPALNKWGRIDALINNAGITKFAAASDLDALSAEDFQRVYAVNVIGPYQMI